MSSQTIERKDHHLDLCAGSPVEVVRPGALFDEVSLIHEALPEMSAADVDLSCEFLGRRLRCPLMFTAITGGTARGKALNLALAHQAQKRGMAIGVGSQRAMAERVEVEDTFQLREVAPDALIVGNIGLWQARSLGVDGVRRLADRIGADAMAVHLNVAQEMVQPEGDRDFGGGLKVIGALAAAFGDGLLVKETGCGISPATARRLVEVGVRAIDVAGLGGTSWIKVEHLRAGASTTGALFAEWGIPTAPAIAALARTIGGQARLVASGGIRDGLMAAKALALGADVVGLALPLLKAWVAGGEANGGEEALDRALDAFVAGLVSAMVLTGSRTVRSLGEVPWVGGPTFERWVERLCLGAAPRPG
ncbi:MAG: type 2 isopentenyl-diphosphate Delta-isomerase [Myxococcaceae bacterium]|nr:type 2 isopentenyl-diphosphate Delta-isomerase [Myxococcaceae bacterium]